ncbi:MAG: RDD family protein [Xanthomonadales bacterium]|nr:RDD family protein [Xanthomonadales bacterium]MCB1634481.1 RDD family protein [Xanthomonadales bacterium]
MYPTRHAQPELYAGFWKRVAAQIVDRFVLLLVMFLLWMVFVELVPLIGSAMAQSDSESPGSDGFGLAANLLLGLIGLPYHVAMESSSWQGSIGKRAAGIKVVDLHGRPIGVGQALVRYLSGFVSALTALVLYIGYWMCGFTERKQALHDMIAGCLVVNRDAVVDSSYTDATEPRSGTPGWAKVLIVGCCLLLPALVVLSIAIPAYHGYITRTALMQSLGEHRELQNDILEQAFATGELPGSLDDVPEIQMSGHRRQTETSKASLVGGTLVIEFIGAARPELLGQRLGFALYRVEENQYRWVCGLAAPPAGAERISDRTGAEITTLTAMSLPRDCR